MRINGKFCLILFLIFSVASQAANRPNFSFSTAELSNQLNQKTVRQIYQDKTGYLWIVTQEGINRFDGYQLISFIHEPRKAGSLSSDNVRAIVQDKAQRLWIATDGGGLNLYNSANQTFSHWKQSDTSANSPLSNQIRSMALDSQGFIWLGYKNGKFSRFNPDTMAFDHFDPRQLLPSLEIDATVTAIKEDGNHMWLATDGNGLLKFAKQSLTLTAYNSASEQDFFSDRLTHLFIDTQQRLWISSYDAGVSVLNPQRNRFTTFSHQAEQNNSLAANLVHTMYQDQKQRMWFGTDAGASLWDGSDKFTTYSIDQGLSDNKVLSI